jgi:GT2 family glycosyltransferase
LKLSLIITTFNKIGVMKRHLNMLSRQTLSPDCYEAIVINDGEPIDLSGYPVQVVESHGKGPAGARNLGASLANNQILVFSQDDALPAVNFLFYHFLSHFNYPNQEVGVQGYTDWWPNIVTDFEQFLYSSGIQANWNALKNDDGSWKKDATGFCLTTNFSIAKSEFERLGGFNEKFPHAAWEDVEFGLRGQKHNLHTIMEPNAINYHAHRQTLDGFVQRQIKEGKSRLIICSIHPEISGSLLDPEGLRKTNASQLQEAIALARETHYSSGQDIQEVRQQRWSIALRLASLEGIRQGIADRSKTNKVWLAIEHLHSPEECHHVVTVASRLETGEFAYAETSAEWALQQNQSNWALWAVRGEVALAKGDRSDAINYFLRSANLGPGGKWNTDRLRELQ